MSPRLNYQKYRSLCRLNASSGPVIPFLGAYLTDLIYIDEICSGKTPKGHINFSKLRNFAKVFDTIEDCRRMRYSFSINHLVQRYLFADTFILSDEQLYKVSQLRESSDEAPTRSLQKRQDEILESEEGRPRSNSNRTRKIKISSLTGPRYNLISLVKEGIALQNGQVTAQLVCNNDNDSHFSEIVELWDL